MKEVRDRVVQAPRKQHHIRAIGHSMCKGPGFFVVFLMFVCFMDSSICILISSYGHWYVQFCCLKKGNSVRVPGASPHLWKKKTRCLNVHLEKFSAFSHISPPPESCLISLHFGRLYTVVIKKMDFGVLIALSMSPHVSSL